MRNWYNRFLSAKAGTALALAQIVYKDDILANNLVPSLCGFFYGTLEVRLEAGKERDSYTTLLRPGVALIHISLEVACVAAGYKPDQTVPKKEEMKVAALIKRAIMTFAYHEIGHLLFTDMSGDQFKPYSGAKLKFVHDVSNILEDIAMERNCMSKHPLYKFSKRYFKWMDKALFAHAFDNYKDNGDLQSFIAYLLGYCRISGGRMPGRNAMFDSLVAKGLVPKLRDAHREPDGQARLAKQIAIAEWILKELGVSDQQLQSYAPQTQQRPIIILIDPQPGGKGKQMKQKPLKGPLPPVSVVECGKGDDDDDEGEGDDDIMDQNPEIIDQRTNPPESDEDEDGEGAGSKADQSDEDREEGDEGSSDDGEGDEDEDDDGDGDGSDGEADSDGEPDGQSSHQAGKGKGAIGNSTNAGDTVPEIDSNDPLSVEEGDSFGNPPDAELRAAIAIGKANGSIVIASKSLDVDQTGASKSRSQFGDARQKNGIRIAALASAIEEMKADTAPKTLFRDEEGEDIDLDAYIDSVVTSTPSIEIFQREIPGVEITDLAVSILVDVSGSMGSGRDACAHLACCLVAQACERSDTPIEIECFSDGDVLYLKEFEDDLPTASKWLGLLLEGMAGHYSEREDITGLSMWGGTNCEAATKTVVERLKLYEGKQKKLLFVITDGDTGSPKTMGETVARAREEGIAIIGIGIGTSEANLRACFGRCKSFNERTLGTLPAYVSEEVKRAIGRVD